MNIDIKKQIQEELSSGVSREDIYTNLINSNYSLEDIDQAFYELGPDAGLMQVTEPGAVEEAEPQNTQAPTSKLVPLIVGLCVLLVAASGLAAASYFKLLPVGDSLPYSKDALASGIAMSLVNMETFTYSLSGTFEIEDRDADAKAFYVPSTPEMKIFKDKYARDYKRMSEASRILSKLRSVIELPETLGDLANQPVDNFYFSSQPINTIDPLTGAEYYYVATENGFRLSVTFETINALNAITDDYFYQASTTVVDISSMTVTFTEESSSYIYFPIELPKTYFEELNEMASYMPPELFFKASIVAASDFSKDVAEWQLSLDVEGDFGDLIYRIAGDVMRSDDAYYFQVRNLPSFFSSFIPFEKNVWVRATNTWLEENNDRGMYSVSTMFIPDQEAEDEYRRFRTELSQFAVAAVKMADEEGVLLVKNEPAKEKIEGKDLYRYDVTFNKENLLPYMRRVVAEAQKYEVTRESQLANDTVLLQYLESEEFNTVFDYYINNTSLTLWVNQSGFIELVEYSIRIVPGDDAVQLANKQARLTIRAGFDNINEPVRIDAPSDYKDIEEVLQRMMGGFQNSFDMNSAEGDVSAPVSVKQNLSRLRGQAELVYNSDMYTYSGVCTDTRIQSVIDSIEVTLPVESSVTCMSGEYWYVIQSPLTETEDGVPEYWCIDSTGYSGSNFDQLSFSAQSCR